MKNTSIFNFRKTFLVCGIAMNALLSAQQWNDVGSSAQVSAGGSSYNNLAVDASGNYYLSYYDVSVAKGSVQKFDGSSWSYLGGSPGITTGVATFNSLAVDAQGSIFYSNQASYPSTGLELRKFSSGSWSLMPSATTASVTYQAIAISSSNMLFAYSSDASGTVRRYKNGTWEQVGNAGFAGGATYAKMMIGSDDNIYACQISGGIKVYKISVNASSADSWTLLGGNAAGNAYSSDNSYSDIALDNNNIPYVVYVSSSAEGRKLNVKKFDGNSWVQVGAANFSSSVVNNTAITVSPNGTPYVVASIWDSSNPNHGKNTVYKFNSTTGGWDKVGSDFISAGASTFNDIAFDAANNYLVLAYSDGGTRVKRIALNTLSVKDIKNSNDSFVVYPNPTSGVIYLKDEKKIKSVEVSNAVGQMITAKITDQQIDISDAPKGVYFVKATFENGKSSVKKIIKK